MKNQLQTVRLAETVQGKLSNKPNTHVWNLISKQLC